jgi:WD40 repeat protein
MKKIGMYIAYGVKISIPTNLLTAIGALLMISQMYAAALPRREIGATIEPLIIIGDANRPSLSFDGSRVATGPEVGLSEVYDVNSGKKLGSYKVNESDSEAISSDGRRVRIFGGGLSTTYDIDNGKLLSQTSASISRNGRVIGLNIFNDGGMTSKTISSNLEIVANIFPWWQNNGSDQPAVIVGRLNDHSLLSELRTVDGFRKGDVWGKIVMTPDAAFVAGNRYNNREKERNVTVVWDAAGGKELLRLPFSSRWLSLSDNGKRLVTAESGDIGEIKTWNLTTGQMISKITQEANGNKILVGAGVISPDGRVLATTRNIDFYFWDTSTGKYLTSQSQEHVTEGNVTSVTFSGDGRRIAVGSDTEIVTVWSVDEILGNVQKPKSR